MTYSLEEKYQLIEDKLLESKEKDPIILIKSIMEEDYINMHGPEHHFLDGASLLIAIKNNGYDFDLKEALANLAKRTIKMPGAMCGYWGVCGSVASIGAVLSILDKTGPLSSDDNYAKHMEFSANLISKMAKIGGPRCCKRNAYLAITDGIKYANEKYHINIPINKITCDFSSKNEQCIKNRCPFYQA